MPRYKPESITAIGLEAFLNTTKPKHDNHGYDFFVEVVNKGINKSNIARMFKVDRRTVISWCAVYDAQKEQ